jgi:hypothetical protein
MDTISVLPSDPGSPTLFTAVVGDKQAVGATIGQAIDELLALTHGPTETTLVVIQPMKPDRFFTAEQRARLGDLMAKLRASRDRGVALPADERAELEGLVQAELKATAERGTALLRAVPS